jgi:hypothetical protein
MKYTKIAASSIFGMLLTFVILATASITTMTANIFMAAASAEEEMNNIYSIISLPIERKRISSLELAEGNGRDNLELGGEFLTYTNDTYGIRIQYPQNWTIKDNYRLNPDDPYITIVSFFAPPEKNITSPREEVTVYVDTQQYRTSLEEYIRDTVLVNNNTQLGGWDNIEIIKSEQNSTLAERPAYKVEMTYRDQTNGEPIDRYLMDTGTVVGDKVYVISYWAQPQTYSKELPDVQKMMDSFKILVNGTINQDPPTSGEPRL